jgi:chromosome segregation ATPase
MKQKVLVGALGIVVGLLLGLAYGHMELSGEQRAHQAKLREMSQRLSSAQRRYVEERTLHTTLEDEQQAVQTQLDTLQKEKERLLSENRQLESRAAALEVKASSLDKKVISLEARAASSDTKNGQLSERLAKGEADRAALDQRQRQTFQTLQDREKELKQASRKYDECAEHNARLYTIADDLIRKYESKGVVATLLTKEPFTQIKRVELEKLVQDYKDKIDQQKIGPK